jgi:hypothetical protein
MRIAILEGEQKNETMSGQWGVINRKIERGKPEGERLEGKYCGTYVRTEY